MTRKFRQLAVFAAVGTASLAAQAVTQAEVDEARNECRQHKLMVQDKGSFARDEDKRAWENACGLASKKMDELAGKEPTAVAAAPPTEQAGAQGEQAAFEAPAATDSAYHYFSQENLKRQAGGGMTAAAQDLQPAAPAAAPPAPAPEAAPKASAAPPQEDGAPEDEAPYTPPSP